MTVTPGHVGEDRSPALVMIPVVGVGEREVADPGEDGFDPIQPRRVGGREHQLDVILYTEASFGSQLASEGRCVDSTVDLLGGRDTHQQGLAVTRKQGSFVTVVGPEQHVGQRRLSAFQLLGMLGRLSWSMLGSRFSGPRYVFAAPLLSLHTEC